MHPPLNESGAPKLNSPAVLEPQELLGAFVRLAIDQREIHLQCLAVVGTAVKGGRPRSRRAVSYVQYKVSRGRDIEQMISKAMKHY